MGTRGGSPGPYITVNKYRILPSSASFERVQARYIFECPEDDLEPALPLRSISPVSEREWLA
jgi:hypothetical protein